MSRSVSSVARLVVDRIRRDRVAALLLAALASTSSAQQIKAPPLTGGMRVQVYLSSTGLGLLALPREVIATVATAATRTPQQTVTGILGAVDGGAESQGWYMSAALAAPAVVNLGALNLTWQRNPSGGDLLGVRLGVLNTTVPVVCDGLPHVVLQLDTQLGDYSAKLSRIGGTSASTSARVEYVCGS